jgi:hypothetical protein
MVNYITENNEVCPAVIVKRNADETVNLQVFRDGNEINYKANVPEGTEPGTYQKEVREVV